MSGLSASRDGRVWLVTDDWSVVYGVGTTHARAIADYWLSLGEYRDIKARHGDDVTVFDPRLADQAAIGVS